MLAATPLMMEAARQQAPPRDATTRTAPAQRATAVVRGRVIAAGSGDPLHRVRLTLNGSTTDVGAPFTAATNDDGRFEITNVPAGTYALTATRAGYLTIQYGQERPRELGQPLVVRDGEVVEHIDIVLFRGAVLAGRVLNEQNEPSAGIRVEALDVRYGRGRRTLTPAAFVTTDDIGEFRISGLDPGTYYVRAVSAETWSDEDPARAAYAYAPTFYPGAVGSDGAQPVSVATGQEVEGLNFALVVGRAARLSGSVIRGNREPAVGQAVMLARMTPGAAGTILSGPIRTDRSGAFEIDNIPPGEYTLSSGSQLSDYASLRPFLVEDGDVSGLLLALHRLGSLAGSVSTDDRTANGLSLSGLRVVPVSTDDSREPSPAFNLGPPVPVTTAGAGAFRFPSIEGQYLFRVEGLPGEWMLKAVTLNDRDITDVPFDLPQGRDTTGLQIVVTRTAGTVAGDVVNASGAPEARSTVVVFSADDRRWGYGTRFVKAGRPDKSGRFTVGGLPAGAYFAVATDYVADGQWNDPDFLRSLVASASRIEVAEGQTGTLKLTVVQEPQR